MVAQVRVQFRDDSVRRWLRGIPGAVDKATSRGLNKAVTQARTQAKDQIKERRNLPVRAGILDDISIKKAHRNRLKATLIVHGRPRSLRRYGARVMGQRGRGKRTVRNAPVQVTVRPGRPRIVQGAFLRKSDGAVFRRVGLARYPLKFLWGPSITTAFTRPPVQRHMERWAARKVPGLIEHEMRRELKRVR